MVRLYSRVQHSILDMPPGCTALHHAASQGHKEVAELLILSAHCDQKDDDRNTPLMKVREPHRSSATHEDLGGC